MPDWRDVVRSSLPSDVASHAEVVEELAQHLDDVYVEAITAGASEADALTRARDELGDPAQVATILRRLRPVSAAARLERWSREGPSPPERRAWIWTGLLRDFRYGLRVITRSPGFTAAAVLTLGLAVGATTSVFSVVSGVLLRPLPYHEPDRLVAIWETVGEERRRFRVASGNYEDWRSLSRSFDDVALFGAAALTLTEDGEPETLLGGRVSASYFPTLGVEPVLGRTFLPEEDRHGAERVIILGHGLWQRRFGGRRDIVGTRLAFDDERYTVVGVMSPGIYPTWPTTTAQIPFVGRYQQFWVPAALPPQLAGNRRTHVFGAMARLRRGVTLDQATEEMDALSARLAERHPDTNKGEGAIVRRLEDEVVGHVRPALLVLLVSVGLVLLMACVNTANLLLARASTRRREFAVRLALGAGRREVIRQLLAEGLLRAGLGGALGVGLAAAGTPLLVAVVPQEVPRLAEVGIDGRVLAFAAVVSGLAAILFGLAPALRCASPAMAAHLKEAGRTADGGRDPLRRLLVVVEVALAAVLMIGSGLLVKSFSLLRDVDPGFNRQRVLTFEITLPPSRYVEWSQLAAFHDQLLDRLETTAGIRAAALAYDHPLTATWIESFHIESRPDPASADGSAWLRTVSAGYFHTMGIPIVRGRPFTDRDDEAHPGAAIVNEAFVREFFPGEDPIGRRLRSGATQWMWPDVAPSTFEIVGIARDVRFLGPSAPPEPAVYLPLRQLRLHETTALVRTFDDPLAIVPAIREYVRALDGSLAVDDVSTMARRYDEAVAQPRFNMLLLGLFAAIALVLALVGVYGLLAYFVVHRTHEIGIRIALGAATGEIVRLVVTESLRLTLGGLALGTAAAAILTRLMASLLYGVGPLDVATFLLVTLIVGGVAILASYTPARRASRLDPMQALRHS